MKFDRKLPGRGVEVSCRLENGKAFLEWEFCLAESENREEDWVRDREKDYYIRLTLTDMQGAVALEGICLLDEEEPLQSILLQPNLWKGPEEPYLYRLEAVLADREGNFLDRVNRAFPLRSVGCMDIQGRRRLFLNGSPFGPKVVSYTLPTVGTAASQQYQMMEDMGRLLGMGANSVCLEGREETPEVFRQLCDRLGLLLFYRKKREDGWMWMKDREGEFRIQYEEDIPLLRGGRDSLFPNESRIPTSLYYHYRAKWSRTPFVYIVPESIKKMENGNFTVRCYSNCDRVALYSDGSLFEFQRGETEFLFQEVPAKTPSLMLTAEGDGCSQAFSVHKAFLAKSCSFGCTRAKPGYSARYADSWEKSIEKSP